MCTASRPSRIAYRLGIDIAQVEAWLSGEQDSERFQRLVAVHKRRKYHLQVRQADRLLGQRAYELRLAAQRDFIRVSRSNASTNGSAQQAKQGRH